MRAPDERRATCFRAEAQTRRHWRPPSKNPSLGRCSKPTTIENIERSNDTLDLDLVVIGLSKHQKIVHHHRRAPRLE